VGEPHGPGPDAFFLLLLERDHGITVWNPKAAEDPMSQLDSLLLLVDLHLTNARSLQTSSPSRSEVLEAFSRQVEGEARFTFAGQYEQMLAFPTSGGPYV